MWHRSDVEAPGRGPRTRDGRSRWSARALTSCLALPIIMLTAGLLRAYRLEHLSFWYDESVSAYMAESRRLDLWVRDVHPPLYIGLLSGWRLASDSDLWLRALSVLFGVATIPLVYGVGRVLFGRSAGLWAAGLLSVTYFHVKYCQEARMYALMGLLFAGGLWGLVIAVRERRPGGWIAYAIFASLLAYSHGIGVVYVAVLAILFPLLAGRLSEWPTWRPWVLAHAAICGAFLPWFTVLLHRAKEVSSGFWISAGGTEPPFFTTLQLVTVAPIPALSSILRSRAGLVAPTSLGRWVWFAPVLLSMVWILARLVRTDLRAARTVAAAYVLPIAALTVISLVFAPVLIPRALLPTVIPVVVLLGSGIECLSRHRPRNRLVLSGLSVILLAATISYYQWGVKEEWREAAAYLGRQVGPDDVLLLDIDGKYIPPYLLRRYDVTGRLTGLPTVSVGSVLDTCREAVGTCLSRAFGPYRSREIVWAVHSHIDAIRGHDRVQTWLDDELESLGRREFEGIVLERMRVRAVATAAGAR